MSSRAAESTAPSTRSTVTPSSRSIPEAAPEALGVGSSEGHDHARYAGLDDRLGTRCSAAVVRARLERHVERGPCRILGAGRERHALGVSLARAGVEALPDHPALLHDHGADERVGTGVPTRLRRELDAPEEVALVALCGRCIGHFASRGAGAHPAEPGASATAREPG